jgi:ABC-2 type transport system permease protein
MNIFVREMKANRKSLILWCVGIVALIGSGMSKYAGLSSSGQSINDMISQMPQSLQAVMGVSVLDLSKATGYYGVLFLYMVLLATVHAAMLGATIISKEERDKTAEFLFVKPASRNKIILSKMLAALLNIAVLNIAAGVSSFLIVGNYSSGESIGPDIAVTTAGLLILQLLFLVMGTAIAAFYKQPKKAASRASGILLLTFFLSIAVDLNENLEVLKYLTPFKYFQAKDMMYGGGFDAVYVALSAVLIAALCLATFVAYRKRDLNV